MIGSLSKLNFNADFNDSIYKKNKTKFKGYSGSLSLTAKRFYSVM